MIYGDSLSIGEQMVLNEDYFFIGPKAVLDVSYVKDLITVIPIKEKLPDALYVLIHKQQHGLTPLAKQLMDEVKAACLKLLSEEN